MATKILFRVYNDQDVILGEYSDLKSALKSIYVRNGLILTEDLIETHRMVTRGIDAQGITYLRVILRGKHITPKTQEFRIKKWVETTATDHKTLDKFEENFPLSAKSIGDGKVAFKGRSSYMSPSNHYKANMQLTKMLDEKGISWYIDDHYNVCITADILDLGTGLYIKEKVAISSQVNI